MKKIYIILLSFCLGTFYSCDDFLDITPTGEVIPETLEEYRGLIYEGYRTMPNERGKMALRTDEADITPADNTAKDIYKDIWLWNDSNPSDYTVEYEWIKFYNLIYIANQIIENQNKIKEGSKDGVNQLVGEAYMMRAYMHFILANQYGKPYSSTASTDKAVPLKKSTNPNEVLPRNTVEEVYKSVLEDLVEAEKRLNVEVWEENYRYRFNTISVDALRSRVYLHMGNGYWDKCLTASQNVLAKQNSLVNLNVAAEGLPNHRKSPEIIVAKEQGITTSLAQAIFVNKILLNQYKTGDMRKSRYYRAITASIYEVVARGNEYSCSFRTGEIYLNAAEAAFHEDDLDGAKNYLLTLCEKRYNTNGYTTVKAAIDALTTDDFLEFLHNERFKELAFEGHRWYDLRRTTQPRIERVFQSETYVLEQGDPRYTLRIPPSAIKSNPGLAN